MTGRTSTLSVSSELERGHVAAVTGALHSRGPYTTIIASSRTNNSIRDLSPSLAFDNRPTPATTPLFGRGLLEMVTDTLRELVTLRTDYQDDWEPPTDFAYRNALLLVPKAYIEMRLRHPGCDLLPLPFAATDSAGGIRMAWRKTNKQVRINCGAKPEFRSYIYFESAAGHGGEELEVSTLAERLYWLVAE